MEVENSNNGNSVKSNDNETDESNARKRRRMRSNNSSETSSNAESAKKEKVADAQGSKLRGIQVDEEQKYDYGTWKKNVSCLYDFMFHHSLTWSSLSCNFGRKVSVHNSKTDEEFVPSTFSWTGKPSEILIADLDIPNENTIKRCYVGRFTETQRSARVQVKKKIIHPGEVNRIRAFKANCPNLICSKTDSPSVFFWDTTKQSTKVTKADLNKPWLQDYLNKFGGNKDSELTSTPAGKQQIYANVPDLTLCGHTDKAEYALDCCSESMQVVSGGSDAMLLVWSIEDHKTSLQQEAVCIQPRVRFSGHRANIEDCAFQPDNSNIVCSVGDDKLVVFWDARSGEKPVGKIENSHKDDINCCAYNRVNPNYLLTGSSDTNVNLIDIRKVGGGDVDIAKLEKSSSPIVHVFEHHKSSVLNLKWSPTDARYFASTSEESPVVIWDTHISASSSMNQPIEPEMIFRHMGHKAQVVDFDWNRYDPWLFTTVSDSSPHGGGTMQIWRISDFITQADNEEFAKKITQKMAAQNSKYSENGSTK